MHVHPSTAAYRLRPRPSHHSRMSSTALTPIVQTTVSSATACTASHRLVLGGGGLPSCRGYANASVRTFPRAAHAARRQARIRGTSRGPQPGQGYPHTVQPIGCTAGSIRARLKAGSSPRPIESISAAYCSASLSSRSNVSPHFRAPSSFPEPGQPVSAPTAGNGILILRHRRRTELTCTHQRALIQQPPPARA